MQPLLVAGLVHFNDTLAQLASSQGGLGCSAAPCELVVPEEGRVLSFESEASIESMTISGGTLTVHCIGEEAPPLHLWNVDGDVHVTGCSMATCDHFTGTLRAEWSGSAECIYFDGTLISPGASHTSITGRGELKCGSDSVTKLIGPDWTISGTGSVDFDSVDEFSFEGGTAGLTVLGWSWMRREQVTIWEFANEAPVQYFEDQTIEVVGGWPEGSTVKSCSLSGTLGYVPHISDSEVFAAEHSYGPVVSIVERSELNGNIRADGIVFLNDVRGDVKLISETTFVNKFSSTGELLIDGPYKIICPECGVVLPYEDSILKAETDILIESSLAHNLELGGHVALLGKPPGRNRRNTDPITLDIDGITTQVPSGSPTISGGTVRLIGNTTIAQEITFDNTQFYFDGFHIQLTDSARVFFQNNSVIHAKASGSSLFAFSQSSSVLSIESSRVDGYLRILVPANPAVNSELNLVLTNVETEKAGGIGVDGGPLSDIAACYVAWAENRDLNMQYLFNWGNAVLPSANAGNAICFYSGGEAQVIADNGACNTTNFDSATRLDAAVDSDNDCNLVTPTTRSSTTTITTTTTTTITTTSSATTAPRPASSSSSSGLSDADIAGIVVGAVIVLAVLITAGVAVFRNKRTLPYSKLPADPNNSR